jgi:GTP 3',8-cyclase
LFDRFDRQIDYLRISVTDKCNLRCIYCMPEKGVRPRRHEDFLRFEQITAIARAAVPLGIRKIRLTGGEPLVKRGIVDLAEMLGEIDGLTHLAMTTNGTMLTQHAPGLKAAGLHSLNISLDTLDPERYCRLTRGGEIRAVHEGIRAALAQQFPLKINMVVLDDTVPAEIDQMRQYCSDLGIVLQLINHFRLAQEKSDAPGFDRPHSCQSCNRIRLLPDGKLKPCLHGNREIAVDFTAIAESLRRAVLAKPARGHKCTNREMMQIGG